MFPRQRFETAAVIAGMSGDFRIAATEIVIVCNAIIESVLLPLYRPRRLAGEIEEDCINPSDFQYPLSHVLQN